MSQLDQPNYDTLAAQFLAPTRTPVQQAHRTPVQQAHRTPVQQAHRTPVQQASRNSIRNSIETHTETQCVCDEKILSEEQIDYVAAKTKATRPEILKAVEILSHSECENMMKMLLTASFYKGKCILEPDRPKAMSAADAARQREDQDAAARRAYLDKCTAESNAAKQITTARTGVRENALQDALRWFQGLPESEREQVKRRIADKHPACCSRLFSGDFGPAILSFLTIERNARRENT